MNPVNFATRPAMAVTCLRSGFLSPTPMFWPEAGKSTRLTNGASMRLQYRVLVFAGTPASTGIDKHHADFAKSGTAP